MVDDEQRRKQRKKQHDDLLAVFNLQHSAILMARRNSPGEPFSVDVQTVLNSAVIAMRASSWYANFGGSKQVNEAIDLLKNLYKKKIKGVNENTYVQPTSLAPSSKERQVADLATAQECQLVENEFWFRRLYASIVSVDEQVVSSSTLPQRRVGRAQFGKAITEFQTALVSFLDRDRELIATLRLRDRKTLEALPNGLEQLAHSVSLAASIVDPEIFDENGKIIRTRASKGPRSARPASESRPVDGREIARDLVEVCLQTFIDCTPEVLKLLLQYPRSSAAHLRFRGLKEIIASSAERKVGNATRWEVDECTLLDMESRYLHPIGPVVVHRWDDMTMPLPKQFAIDA